MSLILFSGGGSGSQDLVLYSSPELTLPANTFQASGELIPITGVFTSAELDSIDWADLGYNIPWCFDFWDGSIRPYDYINNVSIGTNRYEFHRMPSHNFNLFEEFVSHGTKLNEEFVNSPYTGLYLKHDWQRYEYDEDNWQLATLDEYSGAVHVYQIDHLLENCRKIVSVYDDKLMQAVDVAIHGGRVDVLRAGESWLYSFNIDGTPLDAIPIWCRTTIKSNVELIDHFQYTALSEAELIIEEYLYTSTVLVSYGIQSTGVLIDHCWLMNTSTELRELSRVQSTVFLYPEETLLSSVSLGSYGVNSSVEFFDDFLHSDVFLITEELNKSIIRGIVLLRDQTLSINSKVQLFDDSAAMLTSVKLDPFFCVYIPEPPADPEDAGTIWDYRRWGASIDVLDNEMFVTEGRLGTNTVNGGTFGSKKINQGWSFLGSHIKRDTLESVHNTELLSPTKLGIDKVDWHVGSGSGGSRFPMSDVMYFDNPYQSGWYRSISNEANAVDHSGLVVNKLNWNASAQTSFLYYQFKLVRFHGEIKIFGQMMGRFQQCALDENKENYVVTPPEWIGSVAWDYYDSLYWMMDLDFLNNRLITSFQEETDQSSGMIMMPRGGPFDGTPLYQDYTWVIYQAVDDWGFTSTSRRVEYDPDTNLWDSNLSNIPPLHYESDNARGYEGTPFVFTLTNLTTVEVDLIRSSVSLNEQTQGFLHASCDLGIQPFVLPVRSRILLLEDDTFNKVFTSTEFSTNHMMQSAPVTTIQHAIRSSSTLIDLKSIMFTTKLVLTFNSAGTSADLWRIDYDPDDYAGNEYAITYLGVRDEFDTVSRLFIDGRYAYVRGTVADENGYYAFSKYDVLLNEKLATWTLPFPGADPYIFCFQLTNKMYFLMQDDGETTRSLWYIYIDGKNGTFSTPEADVIGVSGDASFLDMYVINDEVFALVTRTNVSKDERGLYLFRYDQYMRLTSMHLIDGRVFNSSDYTLKELIILDIHISKELIILGGKSGAVAQNSVIAINFSGKKQWVKPYLHTALYSLDGIGEDDNVFLGLGRGLSDLWADASHVGDWGNPNGEDKVWQRAKNIPLALIAEDGCRRQNFYAPMEYTDPAFRNGEEPPLYVPNLVYDPSGSGGAEPHEDLFDLIDGYLISDYRSQSSLLVVENWIQSSVTLYEDKLSEPNDVSDIFGFTVWGEVQYS